MTTGSSGCTVWYMTITKTSRTTATPEQAWAVLADLERWPRWTPTVTRVRRLGTPGPPTVGARYEVEQPRLGRSTYEVTGWLPGRGFSWVSRRSGVTTTATHRVRPLPGGTQIELGLTWTGSAAWLVRLLYGRLTERYVAQELSSLVLTAEAGTAARADA